MNNGNHSDCRLNSNTMYTGTGNHGTCLSPVTGTTENRQSIDSMLTRQVIKATKLVGASVPLAKDIFNFGLNDKFDKFSNKSSR